MKACIRMFIATLFTITKNKKIGKFPSAVKWINKKCGIFIDLNNIQE